MPYTVNVVSVHRHCTQWPQGCFQPIVPETVVTQRCIHAQWNPRFAGQASQTWRHRNGPYFKHVCETPEKRHLNDLAGNSDAPGARLAPISSGCATCPCNLLGTTVDKHSTTAAQTRSAIVGRYTAGIPWTPGETLCGPARTAWCTAAPLGAWLKPRVGIRAPAAIAVTQPLCCKRAGFWLALRQPGCALANSYPAACQTNHRFLALVPRLDYTEAICATRNPVAHPPPGHLHHLVVAFAMMPR